MQFQQFSAKISQIRPIFTLSDLNTIFGEGVVVAVQLSRWHKKGYLLKIRNGLYVLSGKEREVPLFFIANLGYLPSYVSLESALYEYGFIPDVVMAVTSVSTKKTYEFNALDTLFSYRQVKRNVFIGYGARSYQGRDVLFAEPEKAILDYLYLHKPLLRSASDIEEARFNYFQMKEKVNKKKLLAYAELFNDRRLVDMVKEIIKNF